MLDAHNENIWRVIHTGTSEQHKDLRQSTQSRESKDRSVFVAWLQDHPPFAGYHADQLVSLSTGIVADASVNCDDAVGDRTKGSFRNVRQEVPRHQATSKGQSGDNRCYKHL